MRLPTDLRLALSPTETYRQLIAEPVRGTWRRALERPALVAVIIGTAVTLSSARRVPLGLVLMGIVCWSFVPLIQLLIGLVVIGRARGRPISVPRCLELLFAGHLPWSLSTLVMVGLYTFTPVPVVVDRAGARVCWCPACGRRSSCRRSVAPRSAARRRVRGY